MAVVVGVDVGGSGLRCRSVVDGVSGPSLSGAGLLIGPAGIDVATLVESLVPLVPVGPDLLVWSMRGLLALADPVALAALIRERVGAREVWVCGDALAAMVGAVGSVRPGAVVAAGTGAIAFATDFDRIWRRVDGWGHILGDRGSAAWVGLQALEAALLTLDGVAPGGDALLAALTEQLGHPESWPRMVMTRPDAVALLAGLAPVVTSLAATDPAAGRICTQAGQELARSLATAAQGIEGVCVSRTGGLFGATPVREAFEAAAAARGLEVQPPAGTGLDGAVLLAEHLAAGHELVGHTAYLRRG
ncbi:MAG TPA: BadF/BadG/BcrA/BcrD ATPase family protein [Lapillicoccus sp.]